jgi:uncharacterized paraquat-inducible protein A
MPIKVTCPECGQRSKAPDDAVGRWAKCPRCEQGFLIPAQPPSPEEQLPPEGPEEASNE